MKTLLILRHAKSAHEHGVADFDRGLTERGFRDAARAGELLAELNLLPGHVVTSPAVRALTTAREVTAAAGFAGGLNEIDLLYHAAPQQILHVVRSIPEDTASALLVGHNPGLHMAVSALTEGTPSFPTTALAVIDLDVDFWGEVTASSRGALRMFWCPGHDRLDD